MVTSPAIRPFASTSFWYKPLPVDAPRHPQSATLVANIQDQLRRYYGTTAINTTRYSAPVYTVGAQQPVVPVKWSNCQNSPWSDQRFAGQIAAVPIPVDAVPSAGTDGEIVIYQPSTDSIWELWRAEKRADGWYACWGGRLDCASRTEGVFPFPYGVAATGLSLLGGMMFIDELQAGHLDHVLHLALPETQKSVFSWPANRTDGRIVDANAIPQGLRFGLDPTINVDALRMHPLGKIIAKAIQQYGLVVRDTSGAVTLYAENPQPILTKTGVNPFTALYAGSPAYLIMRGFPWGLLYALPVDYGKS
jgi:hypothetical protein